VARQITRFGEVDDPVLEEIVDDRAPHVELDEPGPPRVRRQLVAVLVGGEAHDRSLQAQRKILGDHDDVAAVGHEAQGHREDPVVVGVRPQARGQRPEVLVVELDAEGATFVVDRHRFDEGAVTGAELLEEVEAPAGRPAQLGVMALALELGEDHQREHDLVFGEPRHRERVGQEYRGVDDENRAGDQGTGDASARGCARRGHCGTNFFRLIA